MTGSGHNAYSPFLLMEDYMSGGTVKLSDRDWEILIPGVDFKLGNTTLKLKPLGLVSTKRAVSLIKDSLEFLAEKGVNELNYSAPKSILEIAHLVLDKAPELLSESSGLDVEDLNRVPMSVAISLVLEVINVNLQSNEDLIKNLTALAETLTTLKKEIGG